MNKVMAGLQQYQYEVYRNPEVDKKYALKRKTREEKEADLVGRLSTPALKALLEEHGRSVRAGQPLSAAELARRYGADEEVLSRFLEHHAAPVLYSGRDGQVFAAWPDGRDE
ncbi:prepilin-type N-terminal cleavage methylation domain-containing [Micractinium conductrix]|uniref:Prepilin-type N-terminal cleavage methylation domain-containing n=1 Tax=Micractinium conductrix TaxID=554055 RepID=A0A2P6VHK3_9CHLO|nr:prepilin-type N-terminal cleavage methylation domain-containing [Micractinium conductrix]|eukprot:PSC73569.1 prepilin-type N-terminal cleavage methylation domain-containing [Micractinium conductrix]